MISFNRFRRLLRSSNLTFAVLLAFVVVVSGCHKDEGPPPPVSLEELPGALQKAFAKAKPEAAEPLASVETALQNKDYTKALTDIQRLSALPGLNKEQANVTAAGLVTLNNALQEAQSHGDQNAAQALEMYRATK